MQSSYAGFMHSKYLVPNMHVHVIIANIHLVSKAACHNDAIEVKGSSRQQLALPTVVYDNKGIVH